MPKQQALARYISHYCKKYLLQEKEEELMSTWALHYNHPWPNPTSTPTPKDNLTTLDTITQQQEEVLNNNMPALVGEPPQQQEDEEKAPNLQNQNRENPFFENAVVHQYGAPNPWELLEEFKTLEYNIQNWYKDFHATWATT